MQYQLSTLHGRSDPSMIWPSVTTHVEGKILVYVAPEMQKEIEIELPRLLLHAIQSAEAKTLFAPPEKRQRALK